MNTLIIQKPGTKFSFLVKECLRVAPPWGIANPKEVKKLCLSITPNWVGMKEIQEHLSSWSGRRIRYFMQSGQQPYAYFSGGYRFPGFLCDENKTSTNLMHTRDMHLCLSAIRIYSSSLLTTLILAKLGKSSLEDLSKVTALPAKAR